MQCLKLGWKTGSAGAIPAEALTHGETLSVEAQMATMVCRWRVATRPGFGIPLPPPPPPSSLCSNGGVAAIT